MNPIVSFVNQMPVWVLLVAGAIAVLLVFKILSRLFSIIWAVRSMLGVAAVLGVGGFSKGCSPAVSQTQTASVPITP